MDPQADMEAFSDFVEGFRTRLWSRDLAAQSPDYLTCLQKLEEDVAARRLVCQKPFGDPLKTSDLQRANNFVLRIDNEKASKEDWLEKLQHIRQLPDEQFAIAAVLVTKTRLNNHKASSVKALCKGFQKIAEWSTWPEHPYLRRLIKSRT